VRRSRRLLVTLLLLAIAYSAFGLWVRSRRADRTLPPPGELRGAWHVHTTRSDGRGSIDDVVRAARQAGLQFVVLADHNGLFPQDGGYRDGVLVLNATEISSRFGHVVGVGLPRALTRAEKDGDAFAVVEALGGRTVVAHPLHPRRPFQGWGASRAAGLEVASNDSFWGAVVAGRRVDRIVYALLALPWDRAQAVLAFYDRPGAELALYDVLSRERAQALLCSADAHGYPSYRAAFEAFSMHVSLTLTGDAKIDSARVAEALLAGRATCVFDGVAPGWGVSLTRSGAGARAELVLSAPREPTDVSVYRDGTLVHAGPARASGSGAYRICGSGGPVPCGPGLWRVEGRLDERPWLFTNPVRIE
jgi:hypothetical protein